MERKTRGKLSLLTVSAITLIMSTIVATVLLGTSVYAWSTHMTFKNDTPFPLKFQIEGRLRLYNQPNATWTAGAEYVIVITYICPGVYPFDDNGILIIRFFQICQTRLVKLWKKSVKPFKKQKKRETKTIKMNYRLKNVGGI